MNNAVYKRLIVAQMAWQGISTATIQFYLSVYDALVKDEHLSCKEMSELASMTAQACSKHLRILTRFEYVNRRGWRAWSLNDKALKDPHLIKLLRYTNAS